MKRLFATTFVAICCSLFTWAATLPVIPAPVSVTEGEGYFTFDSDTKIAVENVQQLEVAQLFASHFGKAAGFIPATSIGNNGNIVFTTDASLPAEGYKLDVTPSAINIKAADTPGFFYALQTLRQLLPAAFDGCELQQDAKWQVPVMQIEDSPRFGYRSLMVDVARNFLPKSELLKLIDIAAMLKINKLHLHLVDDTGWRIEIKRYPKLMQVGAWRMHRDEVFPARPNQRPGEVPNEGGYYTQDDIRDIVAFAAERQIEVIPEIEMPAHTSSSLAAYPELACPSVDAPITVLPGGGGINTQYIYCAGNDSVFTFLENVLDEVIQLFPSQYIHLGGDEAVKTYWGRCPLCKARMEAENLDNLEDLQGYFMQRMSDYVRSKGKIPMGWDELTNHKLPDDIIIYGWRGFGEAATKAADQGHKFIMTPARVLYFIRYQGPQWFEPYTYFGNITLKDVYEYEPIQPKWKPEYANLLMGIQASMWTEFCRSAADVHHQLFPRLLAAAEVAWCQQGNKDWQDFLIRTDAQLPRLQTMGINYARSMYNIDHKLTPNGKGKTTVEMSCIRPDVEIRYTTDGTQPSSTSKLYNKPFDVKKTTVVKATTFQGGEQVGEVLTLNVNFNKATGRKATSDVANDYVLTNGLRGSDRHSDFEWAGWYAKDGSFVIDLGKRTSIKRIVLGCINNSSMGVHIPAEIAISVSNDNKSFKQVAAKSFTHDEVFRTRTAIEDATFDNLATSGRYVKVEFTNPGKCPKGDFKEGQDTWVYFDEIIVE